MDLTTYSGLQAAALEFMTRAGQSGAAPTWIALAEAKLNRVLGAVEVDATLTGTISSRSVSIASLTMVEPIALMLAETGLNEIELTKKGAGEFTFRVNNGRPRVWSINGTAIDMDCPLELAYPFRFRYRERFALSGSVVTNWLLANHPDIYLAATIMWGAGYNEDWANGSTWKSVLDEGIGEVKHQIAQRNRGVLTVDPALSNIGHWRRTYNDLVNNG